MTEKHIRGLTLAGMTAVVSGVANFTNGLVVKGIDPLVHNVVKNGLVGIVVISLLLLAKKWVRVKQLTRSQWQRLGLVAVVGGGLPFWLFFAGVKQIGGVEGAMIHKTLVLWVALLASRFLQEKMRWKMWVGVILLYASTFVTGFTGFSALSWGHAMVLVATMLWAVENVIAKKTLRSVDVDIVVAARMGGGAAILASILVLTGKAPLLAALTGTQWLMLAGVAGLLFLYVASWYRALALAPTTQVASILVGAVVVTNAANALFITHSFSVQQLMQAGVIVTGMFLVAITGNDVWKRRVKLTKAGV